MQSDTIVAVATSTATDASVNIIRVSGSGAKEIALGIFSSKKIIDGKMLPNMMYLGTLDGGSFKEQAFCVYYKAPYSYTGEDVIEFQIHGGRGVASAVFSLVVRCGARAASAGEFTKRAFLNGKLDLLQAESIRDVIKAESESELNQAYKQLKGELSKGVYEMENKLITAVSGMEAKLDYPEEIEESFDETAKKAISDVCAEIKALLKDSELSKTVTDGVNVAIVGLPNVGKSTLLNALVMADRAIVTPIAGTTRDVLKETVTLGGVKVNFLDTAGIRESADEIEKIGVSRTKESIKSADVVIFVMDSSTQADADEKEIAELLANKKVIRVANKKDIGKYKREGAIELCAAEPHGAELLRDELLKLVQRDRIFSSAFITNRRQIDCLTCALAHAEQALTDFSTVPTECTLLGIRLALGELSKITGRNVSEKIIEQVFATFCVGK